MSKSDIEQAMTDWRSGRAYWAQNEQAFRAGKVNPGNYRLKAAGRNSGRVASWNRSVKLAYGSVEEFHSAARAI